MGVEPVGPAATIAEALRLINETPIDAALLDANLAGRRVDDIAAAKKTLPAAAYSKTCRVGSGWVIAGTAPGGVGFELCSPHTEGG